MEVRNKITPSVHTTAVTTMANNSNTTQVNSAAPRPLIRGSLTREELLQELPTGLTVPPQTHEFTLEHRVLIEKLLLAGWSKPAIAKILGKERTCINREVSKYSDPDGTYNGERAHARNREVVKNRGRKVMLTPELKESLEAHFAQGLTPETLVKNGLVRDISVQTLYLWIRQGRLHYDYYIKRS